MRRCTSKRLFRFLNQFTEHWPWSCRRNGHENRIAILRMNKLSDSRLLCSIFMLLIMVLRIEKVAVTLINELLTTTIRRIDKQVQWTHSYRSVIVAVHTEGASCLELDKPAFNTQINDTFCRASLLCDIIKSFASHSLRRKAVSDMKHIKKLGRKSGKADDEVATMLNHSKTAYSRGLTDTYSEHVTSDMWSSKITEVKNEGSFDFTNIHELYRKRKLSFDVINKVCEEQELNLNHRLSRKRMIKKLHVDNLIQWRSLNQFRDLFRNELSRLLMSPSFKLTLTQYHWHL